MIRLKELRLSKNINQKDFAVIIGVSQPTLSQWETGKTQIDYDNLQKLSDYFNVSIDFILGYSDSPNPPKADTPATQPLPYSARILELAEKINNLSPEMRASIEAQIKLFQQLQQEIEKNK